MHFHADVLLSCLSDPQSIHSAVCGVTSIPSTVHQTNKFFLAGKSTTEIWPCQLAYLQHVLALAGITRWTCLPWSKSHCLPAPIMHKNTLFTIWMERFEVLILVHTNKYCTNTHKPSHLYCWSAVDSLWWNSFQVFDVSLLSVLTKSLLCMKGGPSGLQRRQQTFSFTTFLRAGYPQKC